MMCGLIDLNAANDDTDEVTTSLVDSPSSSSSYASAAAELSLSPSNTALASPAVCCLELWHACAGPLISLPKKGNVIVYFPQGHLEQQQTQRGSEFPAIGFNLSPHVFCRVLDVKLHAEVGTDDVYAQVSLIPDSQLEQKWREGGSEAVVGGDDNEGAAEKATTPHMFCKTLTASDTSTHGGFSVPRRAAEDCFPPLDYKQQRPSQELVAKDLHGTEWKFRHIYRGQPRRHLLTTGWSAFVNKKKLVCGDAVLFLRGDDGVLRLGIRRAAHVKNGPSYPPLCVQQLNDFASVVHSISQKTVFNVYYNPRGSSSDFIVPHHQFLKSLAHSFSAGMRFKKRFETEDAAERRSTGIVTGMSDMDPIRWPGSKWRCLMVRWDGMDPTRQNRVSPWEIERCGSLSGASSFAPVTKRIRTAFPPLKSDFPASRDGAGVASDFGESLRFQKVLQGQEIFGYNKIYGVDAQNHNPSEMSMPRGESINSRVSPLGNGIRNIIGIGFGESFGFNKVLQGQEIIPSLHYGRGPGRVPSSGNGWAPLSQDHNNSMRSSQVVEASSSPSSVLLFQQAISQAPNSHPICVANNQDMFNFSGRCSGQLNIQSQQGHSSPLKEKSQHLNPPFFSQQEESVSTCKNSCRLFGFSLTEESNNAMNRDGSTPQHASPYVKKPSLLPAGEDQVHQKRPIVNSKVGGSCINERVHQWSRATDGCLQGS